MIVQWDLKKCRLLSKQQCICSNIFVIISVFCIHYKVSKDCFTLQSLFNLWTFKIFQDSYSSPTLNHAFDVCLAEKYLEPPWISVPAKTRTAGAIMQPLVFTTLHNACYYTTTINTTMYYTYNQFLYALVSVTILRSETETMLMLNKNT